MDNFSKIFLIYIEGLFITLSVIQLWDLLNITLVTNIPNLFKISLIAMWCGLLGTYWCKKFD